MMRKRTVRVLGLPTTPVLLLAVIAYVTVGLAMGTDGIYSTGVFQLGDGEQPPGEGTAAILSNPGQPGPNWEDLFNSGRGPRDDYDANGQPGANGVPDYIDLYGGQAAVFTADDLSLGLGLDTTALAGSENLVENGTPAADHDIGNAYVYSTVDPTGSNKVVLAGVERLGGGDSFFEFELNQAHVRLGHGGFGRGEPWRIDGARVAGDLLVRLSFVSGVPALAISKWTEGDSGAGSFELIETVAGEHCNAGETACVVCNGVDIEGGPWPNFGSGPDPEMITAERFVELGVNVGALLGNQPDYTSIRVRTPQDIAFGYFAEGN